MSSIPEHMKERAAQAKIILEGLVGGSSEVIVQGLEHCKADFLTELEGLSAEQIDFKPAEDRWSIREISLHVSNSMRMVGTLVDLLGAGQMREHKPTLSPDVLDDDPGDWHAVVNFVSEGFDASLKADRVLDSMSDPDDTLDHPWFGPFNSRQWSAFNIIHARVHVMQLGKNKAAEGYPAS